MSFKIYIELVRDKISFLFLNFGAEPIKEANDLHF